MDNCTLTQTINGETVVDRNQVPVGLVCVEENVTV